MISITDDDDPNVSVTFEHATYNVNEGSSINITVKLDADPERTARIPLTVINQNGATDADHSLIPEAETFNSGQLSRIFSFQADQDTDDDGESVKIGFGTMPARASAGSTSQTIVSITDDDVPAVNVSFEQATYTVAEGSTVTVKVKLSADPERSVTIPITKAHQGGTSSGEYSGVPANLTFARERRRRLSASPPLPIMTTTMEKESSWASGLSPPWSQPGPPLRPRSPSRTTICLVAA